MVSNPSGLESLRSGVASRAQKCHVLHRPKPGAYEKQVLAAGCLEDLWEKSLKDEGWSDRAASQFQFCLAKSIRAIDNNLLLKCSKFCKENNKSFPPKSTAILADFLCNLADSSQRPKSLLCTALAALSLVYNLCGL